MKAIRVFNGSQEVCSLNIIGDHYVFFFYEDANMVTVHLEDLFDKVFPERS